jgi:hypothetical protein
MGQCLSLRPVGAYKHSYDSNSEFVKSSLDLGGCFSTGDDFRETSETGSVCGVVPGITIEDTQDSLKRDKSSSKLSDLPIDTGSLSFPWPVDRPSSRSATSGRSPPARRRSLTGSMCSTGSVASSISDAAYAAGEWEGGREITLTLSVFSHSYLPSSTRRGVGTAEPHPDGHEKLRYR